MPGPPGGGPNVGLPSGIYGEERGTDGSVEALTIGLDGAGPRIPSDLPLERLVTVDGKGGDHDYRVFAVPAARATG